MSRRKQVYEGKAKVLFEGPEPGTLVQYFKDDATAFNNQKKGTITGKGVLNNRISEFLMTRLAEIGIPTHFVRRLNMREQLVRQVEIIPIEVVIRNVVAGSLDARALAISVPVGLLLAAILPGNDWRDVGEDARAGISTFSIRAGRRAAYAGYVSLVIGAYLALGITVLLATQTLVNLGVVTGLLPTKGLPLPFISFGGPKLPPYTFSGTTSKDSPAVHVTPALEDLHAGPMVVVIDTATGDGSRESPYTIHTLMAAGTFTGLLVIGASLLFVIAFFAVGPLLGRPTNARV